MVSPKFARSREIATERWWMFQARQLCSIEDIKLRILKSIGFLEKSRMCGIFDETYTYDCLQAKYLNRSKFDDLISKSK